MNVFHSYEALSRYPLGKWIFSRLFCWRAPYFGTIRPLFSELRSGVCVVKMKKRRGVTNHIGTVHAIAMCNMAEAAAGLCTEVSLAKKLRWIPKKMEVEYLKKAGTDLVATCRVDPEALTAGEKMVPVEVTDTTGETVFRAKITMYISEKKISPKSRA